MEVTIYYNGQAVAVEVTLEVYELPSMTREPATPMSISC